MENELLYEMQNAFPMTERPFKDVAEKLEVLSTVQKLKDGKIIRQTSAIFDTKRLGYKSSLVAFKEKVKKTAHKEIELTPKHIAVIKELQKDIDVVSEPYKEATEKLGMDYDEFFEIANELKESGVMRRFATILNHRKAGFGANAMSVWAVPEEKGEEIGRQMAEFSAVSHCYLRPSYPNWPYNLFAMVHAKTQEECDTLIEEMAKESGLTEYGKLYSTVEFKKQRLVYFDDAFKEWEAAV